MDSEDEYLVAKSLLLSGLSDDEWTALREGKGDWPVETQQWKKYRHFSIPELKEMILAYTKSRCKTIRCYSLYLLLIFTISFIK